MRRKRQGKKKKRRKSPSQADEDVYEIFNRPSVWMQALRQLREDRTIDAETRTKILHALSSQLAGKMYNDAQSGIVDTHMQRAFYRLHAPDQMTAKKHRKKVR